MRQQLEQYVNLLFAGNPGMEEIKEEILQNTLERYDDLIAQGKAPEAAYRLAIAGIGDINEIISGEGAPRDREIPFHTLMPGYVPPQTGSGIDRELARRVRAAAIGLYIVSIIPLIALDAVGYDILGLCLTLMMVGCATVLMIIYRDPDKQEEKKASGPAAAAYDPNSELKDSVRRFVRTLGLVTYFAVSFLTGAWHITWLLFPIMAALNGLLKACIDLWEVSHNED